MFKRTKTGPLAFNVEYQLQVLRCKKRALTPEECALVEAEPTIDTKYVRPTPDEVKALLEKLKAGIEEEESEAVQVSKKLLATTTIAH